MDDSDLKQQLELLNTKVNAYIVKGGQKPLAKFAKLAAEKLTSVVIGLLLTMILKSFVG